MGGQRSPPVRYLVAMLAVTTLLAAGTEVHVGGWKLIPLPLAVAPHLPILNHIQPARFAVFVSLAASVGVAAWIAGTAGRLYARPYVLPLVAVFALLPTLWHFPTFGTSTPARPAFFADRLYETCLPRGETIATFSGGDGALWQAESDFWFRLAGNGLQPYGKKRKPANSFDSDP